MLKQELLDPNSLSSLTAGSNAVLCWTDQSRGEAGGAAVFRSPPRPLWYQRKDNEMSHYVECKPGFKDQQTLIEALIACRFRAPPDRSACGNPWRCLATKATSGPNGPT